jgi:hypothetical protein
MMMLSPAVFIAAAEDQPTAPTINTAWLPSLDAVNQHAYLFTFSDNGSYDVQIDVTHIRDSSNLENEVFLSWDSVDNVRIAYAVVNTSLEWNDEITVDVTVQGWNGDSLETPLQSTRTFTVGTWNQPMADHEILLSTEWELNQSYSTDEGEQGFYLHFNGQGWQMREGTVLNSWELGNGTLSTVENSNDSSTNLTLNLESIWKNETVESGILTSQVFDARGNGVLHLITFDGTSMTEVVANVSEGHFNRSMIDGKVSERLRIEATGELGIVDETNESLLDIGGEVSVLVLETWDENGVRRLQHTQIEAMADMTLIDEDVRMDISLDGVILLDRWEDGVRTDQKNELMGQGTFGFNDQDENSSIAVNGTILDFHLQIEDGITMIDDLHVDGQITGDAQGSFGIVRTIEQTGDQANATQEVFLVNVIHQESWFNITGINGGNFFDGQGVGANHNESWDYQVVNADWDNRTVRLVWEETGAESSSGDERPENSPIQINATQPDTEEILGNITVSRETGLVPIPMIPGDSVRLRGQEGLFMTVTATSTGNDPRDGFNLHVVHWDGTYFDGGSATGSIVDQGPLMGLISSVQRILEFPYGESNETANFSETQVVERILSPSVITSENNSAPVLEELFLVEGLIYGEGGTTGTLVAHFSDAEFNIETVTIDLSPIGGEVVVMNDRGLNGDTVIGDSRFTTMLMVQGLEVGNITLEVTAIDAWGLSAIGSGEIEIINQGPRMYGYEILPDSGPRGATMIVNTRAYDGHGVSSIEIDLRESGGEMVSLTDNPNGVWTGTMTLPESMMPGDHLLQFVLTDGLGSKEFTSLWNVEGFDNSLQLIYGPHHVSDAIMKETKISVLNTPPVITGTEVRTFERSIGGSVELLEVQIEDYDGILVARADLGVFTPLTSQSTWQTMYDDGTNGDKIANDGTFSVELTVRESIPLGTHEILVQASDTYGAMSSTESIAVQLTEQEQSITGVSGSFLTTGIMIGVLAMFAVGVGLVILVSIRNRPESEDGKDRFGFQ